MAPWLDRPLVIIAALVAVAAVLSAYIALRVREWEWFTAHAWVPDEKSLAGVDHLRRHYIQWTYRILSSMEDENHGKATAVSVAQNLLTLAVALVLAVLLNGIVAALP